MANLTVHEKIMKQRMALCLDEPFFGVLLMRLNVKQDQSIPTMATDGVNLFWNADYVDPMPPAKLKGLLAHEVMHNALCHHTRRGSRDPQKWNLACDAAIDHILEEAGMDVPNSFAHISSWDWAKGMSAEHIYARIPDPPKDGSGGGGGGEGVPRPGSVMDLPTIDKGEAERISAEGDMKIAVRQAEMSQKSYDRRKGSLSGWLKLVIEEICQPKVRWEDVLRRFMSPQRPTDQSWSRPNRRYVSRGVYLPGYIKGGIGEGVVFADSSGSCIQDWPQFLGELQSIFSDICPERVHVVLCDSSVKSIQTYEAGEEFNPDIEGGGGSDFRPAFDAVSKLSIIPQWAVVLSDMYIEFPIEAPPYPVIAVSTTEKSGPEWAENIFIHANN